MNTAEVRPLGISGDLFLTSRQQARLRAIEEYDLEFIAERLRRKRAVPPELIEDALFEFRRYMALVALGHHDIAMISQDVDEVWHNFIVFTRQYSRFCETVFEEFIHHDPNVTQKARRAANFVRVYTRVFGPPPPIWYMNQH
jgi:hypothetical protein